MQLQAGKKINDIAIVLDEAFVLLILQNIWDDMMEVDINKYYQPKKREKMKQMATMKIKKILMRSMI